MLWVGGKFFSIKKMSTFLFNPGHGFRMGLMLLHYHSKAATVSFPCEDSTTVHYGLPRITASKPHAWPQCCLSSFADRQAPVMGTAWARFWHLKGQTLNVVTSSASRPLQAALPLWAQINAVMSDRSTCSLLGAKECERARVLCADLELLMGIFCFNLTTYTRARGVN